MSKHLQMDTLSGRVSKMKIVISPRIIKPHYIFLHQFIFDILSQYYIRNIIQLIKTSYLPILSVKFELLFHLIGIILVIRYMLKKFSSKFYSSLILELLYENHY